MGIILSVAINTNAYSTYKRGAERAVELVNKSESTIIFPIILGELGRGFSMRRIIQRNLMNGIPNLQQSIKLSSLEYPTYFKSLDGGKSCS